MNETRPRVRIAPSPTGDPHVGTAYVALFNRAFAQTQGGTFLLRIDDTDRTRYRADSEASIFGALTWLGLHWDEGPDKGGPFAPYRQSERTDLYREAAESLLEQGQAYRCFCTADRLQSLRASQREEGKSYGYDRHCRDLSAEKVATSLAAGEAHTIRLKVPLEGKTSFKDELRGLIEIENREIDDQILLKSDGFPTYHLANVVDDAAMGITHVVRAEEWIISTPKHVLIYHAMKKTPPAFCHVPLLRNADHSKISKRKNPVSLDWYREQGYLPEALLNFLALLGWSPPDEEEVFGPEKFAEHFRLQDISTGGPVFDLVKLQWLNGVYLRKLSPAELTQRLESEGFLPAGVSADGVAKILPLVAERLHLLSDFAEQTQFFFGDVTPDPAGLIPKKRSAEDGCRLLAAAAEGLSALTDWNLDTIGAALDATMKELELKKPQLFMPLRTALTGKKDSPSIFEVVEVLGQERVVARLRAAESILKAANLGEDGGPKT